MDMWTVHTTMNTWPCDHHWTHGPANTATCDIARYADSPLHGDTPPPPNTHTHPPCFLTFLVEAFSPASPPQLSPQALVTQPWPLSPAHSALVTETWPLSPGHSALVTQPWPLSPGRSALVTFRQLDVCPNYERCIKDPFPTTKVWLSTPHTWLSLFGWS